MDWESGISRGNLSQYSPGSSSQYSVIHRDGKGDGKECVYMCG